MVGAFPPPFLTFYILPGFAELLPRTVVMYEMKYCLPPAKHGVPILVPIFIIWSCVQVGYGQESPSMLKKKN